MVFVVAGISDFQESVVVIVAPSRVRAVGRVEELSADDGRGRLFGWHGVFHFFKYRFCWITRFRKLGKVFVREFVIHLFIMEICG